MIITLYILGAFVSLFFSLWRIERTKRKILQDDIRTYLKAVLK